MTAPTYVQKLAQFAADHHYDALPPEVATSTRQRILDIVGLCLASLPLETSSGVLRYVGAQGGAAQASAIGLADQVPASQAAFVNGVLAHSLDYDDTHLPSILHPSASVVPAALAAGEAADASGAEVLAAVAVGLEICVRLGMAGYDREANNSLFFERGQHATSICGAIASAASAAILCGLGADGAANAMGVAVSMAGGVIEANRTGGTVKRLHCGWAAHAGVTAAELVAHGITGPPTVLEGRFGFYEAFLSGRFEADELDRDLGVEWAVPGIFFKPYPANHFTHAGIDAALALRAAGLRPEDVASAHLGVAGATARTIGQPLEEKQRPQSGYHAKFSGPYTVAAALSGGGGLGLGLDDFTDELAADPDRIELMSRITVGADETCEAIYPHQFPAVLTVQTTDGRTLVQEVLANRGGPERPLTDDELGRKFTDNAGVVLDAAAVAEVRSAIEGMAERRSIRGLLEAARAV